MLRITHLNKFYTEKDGAKLAIFKNFNLEVNKGEFVGIFGPNGCGKTTLLNLIAGLDRPNSGKIIFNAPATRRAVIFQNYRESLFPWLSVRDNIAYPLKLRGIPLKERHKRAEALTEQFGIKINLESFPYTLSGGQQQFAAILRALMIEPDLILMDEPFSSLDYQATLFMLRKMQEIWEETGITFIFVSHEIDEAIFLAQRVVLLSNKPTRVVKDIVNSLSYPRTTAAMGMPEFIDLICRSHTFLPVHNMLNLDPSYQKHKCHRKDHQESDDSEGPLI